MNSLSWLIYLADVADGVDWYLDVAWFISFLLVAGGLIVGCAMAGEENDPPGPEHWKTWRRVVTGAIAVLGFSTLFGAVVPAKETVYAIAASEMGEKLIKTDTANKALNGVNAWLDKQIKGEEAPTKKEGTENE